MSDFDYLPVAWLESLKSTRLFGSHVVVRGVDSLEILHKQYAINMRKPVLNIPARHMNYRYMAAEAHWVLTGDDRVDTIAPYNPKLANFSDNGHTFFGAYGPKVAAQMNYIIDALSADMNSRRAVLNIWRESPRNTRDTPCVVSCMFVHRNGKLNMFVFMRSSDTWLGLPYDVFTFSMMAHMVCALFNERHSITGLRMEPGTLFLTAASSHLYQHYVNDAAEMEKVVVVGDQPETPVEMFESSCALMETLAEVKNSRPGSVHRWWEAKNASKPE